MSWKLITKTELPADNDHFLLGVAYADGSHNVGEANRVGETIYWAGGPSVELGEDDEAYWQPMPDGPFHSKSKRS